jgi:hypothetical protein
VSDRPAPARELLARAPFPLFGIAPASWDGPVMVGGYSTSGERIRDIAFLYLDQLDERSMGLSVTNLDGAARDVEPLEVHLLDFISRFDDTFLVSRVKRRRFEPFPSGDLQIGDITVAFAGRTVAAKQVVHRLLPLRLVRAPVRIGTSVTDVGISGWNLDPLGFVGSLVPVDVAFADQLDALAPRIVRLDEETDE